MWWLWAACHTPEPPPPPPPSVLLVTLDTTRADALGLYGASPSPSPTLDTMASRGRVVDELMTTVPLTLPAHASLMTGLWPDAHGVRDNLGFRLDDAHDTLAERFDTAGYDTAAFVSAIVLDARFGLEQGFDHYDDGFDLTTAGTRSLAVTQHDGAEVTSRAIAWLSERPDAPFFAWVHLYDPHRPYAAPEPWSSQFPPYEAEIAYADAQVARLLAALDSREDVVVVVLSDHGEGNGDHGELTHGQHVYRSTMRIPFIMTGPGVPTERLPGPSSLVDVPGTLTALAGLPAVGMGSTLDNPADVPYGETLYPRLNLGLHDLATAQDDRFRLIHGARDELFDWRADPGELQDVAAQHPDVVIRLRAALDAHDRSVDARDVDAETTQALAQLGYLAGLPADDDAPLRDPRDAPDMATAFETVVLAARTRPPLDGAVLLEAFLADYPAVSGARQMLVSAYEAAGDTERALGALQPLLDAHPDDAMLRARRAELMLNDGDIVAAIAELQTARDTDPDNVALRGLLAELYRRQGRCDAAVREADAGLAVTPEGSRLLLVRGTCRHDAGQHAAAEADLRAVLRLDPSNRDVYEVLGHVLIAAGRYSEAAAAFVMQQERTPERAGLDALRGAALYADGELLAAIAPLGRAASKPGDGESRLLLADALYRTSGDSSRVQSLLDEADPLLPDDRRVREVRATIRLDAGDTEGALSILAAE